VQTSRGKSSSMNSDVQGEMQTFETLEESIGILKVLDTSFEVLSR
jgi:hypothetical protein